MPAVLDSSASTAAADVAVHPDEDGTTYTTPRLTLRRFTPDDGPALHTYLGDPVAVRFEPSGPQSADDCDRLALARASDPAFWAVCARDGDLIGNLYLAREQPHAWNHHTLGYVFSPAVWGRGLATEACRALLDECFGPWGAHRVSARCNPENHRSWRLLERLGLRREGHLVEAATFADDADGRPVWHDAYTYAVLDREWRDAAADHEGDGEAGRQPSV